MNERADLRVALHEYIAWVPDDRPIEKIRADLLALLEPGPEDAHDSRLGDASEILASLSEAVRRLGTDNHGFVSTREVGDLIRAATSEA